MNNAIAKRNTRTRRAIDTIEKHGITAHDIQAEIVYELDKLSNLRATSNQSPCNLGQVAEKLDEAYSTLLPNASGEPDKVVDEWIHDQIDGLYLAARPVEFQESPMSVETVQSQISAELDAITPHSLKLRMLANDIEVKYCRMLAMASVGEMSQVEDEKIHEQILQIRFIAGLLDSETAIAAHEQTLSKDDAEGGWCCAKLKDIPESELTLAHQLGLA